MQPPSMARASLLAPLITCCALLAAQAGWHGESDTFAHIQAAPAQLESQGRAERSTRVSVVNGQWHINGTVTYPGTKAEGLLMNVRMVNAVFEDANDTTRPEGFDADANTDAFITQIPDYVAGGVRGFTTTAGGVEPTREQTQLPYFPPADGDGGWRSLKDADQIRRVAGIDTNKLDEAFAFVKGSTKHGGLLVLRRGWLVYEEYFGLGDRRATPNLASVGKSFTSIAVGILLSQRANRFPNGLDQEVFTPEFLPPEAFPLTDPRKAKITLGQLLAMTAGIRGNNPVHVLGKERTIDPAGPDGALAATDAVALGKKDVENQGRRYSTRTLWCEPGDGYSYATSSIHLASMVLRHVTGVELQQYVDTHLARPMGWSTWGYAYRNVSDVTHTPGGGGIAVRATDMLRFGYLLLREGRWNDAQLVPAEYVRRSARQSPYNPHYPYSLQFNVNTNGDIPELPRDAFWKGGSGGHAIYIVPSLDLVVWKLGGRDGQFSAANTGLPPSPASREQVDARAGWKETVDSETALRTTLKMVIESIVERPGSRVR